MTTFLIGYVDEVRPTTHKNKTTGVVSQGCLLTVTFQAHNNEGYLIKNTEDVPFGMDKFEELRACKGKYIVIPYTTINTKNGTFTFPNDDMQYLSFDKNPLEYEKNKK